MAIQVNNSFIKTNANDPGYFPGTGLSIDHLKKLLFYMSKNKGTVYEVYVFDYNYRWVTLTRSIIDLVELQRVFVSNYRVQRNKVFASNIDDSEFDDFGIEIDPMSYYDECTQEVIRKKIVIAVARKTGKKYSHKAVISLTKKVIHETPKGRAKLTRAAKMGPGLSGTPKLGFKTGEDEIEIEIDEETYFKFTKAELQSIKQDKIERAQLRHNL